MRLKWLCQNQQSGQAKNDDRLNTLRQTCDRLEKAVQDGTAAEKKAAQKRLESCQNKLDRLQYGSYYAKQKKREHKEKLRRQKQEEKKAVKLEQLDKSIAGLPAESAQRKRLEKRRKAVALGRKGLRREKADAVQQKQTQLEEQLAQVRGAILYEKTEGAYSEKTLKKLARQEKSLEKQVLRCKERIRKLQQSRFITIHRRKSLHGLMFISPWLVGFLVLFVYPLVKTVQLSVGEIVDLHTYTIEYTGFQHFSRILFEETEVLSMLLDVLKNSFVNMLMITVFAFYIATLLNRKIRARGLFRMICFLPVVLGSGFIMQQLLSQDISQSSMQAVMDFLLPKEMLVYIGPKIANAVVIFLNRLTVILWHSGVQILIFLSGLQSISPSLYEASRVDGATEWENLWFITIPIMTPMILLNLVYTVVDTFNDSSNKIINYMQQYAFYYNEQSYAAAMGIFFMFFSLLLVGLVFLVMRPFTKNVKR